MHYFKWFLIIFLLSTRALYAQKSTIDGYVFEEENRGFLRQVEIRAFTDKYSGTPVAEAYSDEGGHFIIEVPAGKRIYLKAEKPLFYPLEMDTVTPADGQKLFLKMKLHREPGYIFEMLIAEATDDPNAPMESIKNTRIEIYNNTTAKEELVLKDYPRSEFNFTFKKGNHYTIMIRKKGFLTRRMEAYVNVRGCILCFDGIGNIEPGVTDNISSDQSHGTLLATVLLRPAVIGSSFKIRNIHYDYNKSYIRPDAAIELDKVVRMLKDNPALKIELGSHTDARGKDEYNMRLSQKRAEAAVKYIVQNGIDASRITAKGYGETKITNRCVNGVNCSDKEHEENRRTEIKITGIDLEKTNEFKSLKQIIEEENFMRKVMKGESEVVEFKEGDEIPQDLKSFLAEKNKQKVQTGNANPEKTAPRDKDGISDYNGEDAILAHIPASARIPSNYTGYMIFLETAHSLYSPQSKRFAGLKKIYIEKNDSMKESWNYYTGPFSLYTKAMNYYKKMKQDSAFKSVRLVLFKDGVVR